MTQLAESREHTAAHDISSEMLRLTFWALGLWTLLGFIAFLQLYSSMVEGHHSVSLTRSIEIGLGNAWLKALLSLPVLWALLSFNIKPRAKPWRIAVYCLLLIGFTVAHIALRPLLIPIIIIGADGSHYTYAQFLAAGVQSFTLDDVLAFSLLVFGFHSWRYSRESRMRALREQALLTRLATAELEMLKMQLQPHFLFNTLNSIYHLTADNRQKAQLMIERLSRLLRLSLDHVSSNMVPLQRELEFLDGYLDIEKIRFEERLQIVREIAPEAMQALVPNMILQPLVENAIQHGVNKIASGGRVRICVAKSADRLSIVITNDFRATNGAPRNSGLGLGNTRARLTQLFGEDFSLVFAPSVPEARLAIDMPFLPSAEAAVEKESKLLEDMWIQSQH